MLEVEVKFAVPDFAPLEAVLDRWGATLDPVRLESDQYFNAPDRDFAATDEALRIRSVGHRNVVTYKGPKRDRETKTRPELEVPLGDGPDAAAGMGRIFTLLGYRPTAIVRKARRIAHVHRDGVDLNISLDDVTGIGRFAEVEALAEESQFPAAKATVLAVARELGMTESIRRSYLSMVLERQTGS